jgi:hypothetical protein
MMDSNASVIKMTRAALRELSLEHGAICLACGTPNPEGYEDERSEDSGWECETCGEPEVYCVDEALAMKQIVICEDSADANPTSTPILSMQQAAIDEAKACLTAAQDVFNKANKAAIVARHDRDEARKRLRMLELARGEEEPPAS